MVRRAPRLQRPRASSFSRGLPLFPYSFPWAPLAGFAHPDPDSWNLSSSHVGVTEALATETGRRYMSHFGRVEWKRSLQKESQTYEAYSGYETFSS